MNREKKSPKAKESKLTERKRKIRNWREKERDGKWTMVGLSVSGSNQCSQLSKAQLHIVHSTPQVPIFFFLSFFGGYELIFFLLFYQKKKGMVCNVHCAEGTS